MPGINIPVRYDIKKNLPKYERIRILLENDESQYTNDTFCLKFPNEPENARAIRKTLLKTSFRNITHDLISATKDAIFHESIRLSFKGNEKNPLYTFSKDVTLGGNQTSLLQYAGDVVVYGLRAYGHVWTVLDKPDYLATNFQDELENGKPYLSNIWPGNVLNYELKNGELEWFAYKYCYYPSWQDPLSPPPSESVDQVRIWTRNAFIVISGDNIQTYPHNFGFVPVVYQSFILPPDESSVVGITPFFASSNMIIFANNMQSVADMEIIKHGTSVLLVNDNAVNNQNTEVDGKGVAKSKMNDAAGMNMYIYSGETPPEYLIKELGAVDKANNQAQYYFNAAIENERSLQSIQKKRETVRESGETKEYDAEPARAAIRATAEDVEEWCKKILTMAANLYGQEQAVDELVCEFPENYIVTGAFNEKLDQLKKMKDAGYPSQTGMKESFKSLTPNIAHNQDIRTVIDNEIQAAEINVDADKKINEEVAAEVDEDKKFNESIKDLPPEEQDKAKAKRKLEKAGAK